MRAKFKDRPIWILDTWCRWHIIVSKRVTLLIRSMSQCQERRSNTGGNSNWAVRQSIQRSHRNFCVGIRGQWRVGRLGFEPLRQGLSRKSLGNVWPASTPVSKSARICGHLHSHSDKVAPIEKICKIHFDTFDYGQTYKLVEVNVVKAHDIALISQLRLFLVLAKFHGRQSRTWHCELDWVAPHFSLMRNRRFGVLLCKITNCHTLSSRLRKCLTWDAIFSKQLAVLFLDFLSIVARQVVHFATNAFNRVLCGFGDVRLAIGL